MPTAITRQQIGHPGPGSRQRGVVLFIALIVLVAMTLAGIAAVRSVDTTVQIAGNLAFKQSTTLGGDRAFEVARTWLLTKTATGALFDNDIGNGYYAAAQTTGPGTEIPWRDYDWTNQSLAVAGADAAGNAVRYVIHRMCNQAGDPAIILGMNCLTSLTTTSSGSGKGAGRQSVTGSSLYYYRVTVRVTGPRNTISYVQTMIEL